MWRDWNDLSNYTATGKLNILNIEYTLLNF